MDKKILWYMLTLTLLGACVSSKKYQALEAKYHALNDSTSTHITTLEANNAILQKQLDALKQQRALLEKKNATLQLGNEKSVAMLNKLMKDYTSLEKEHITLLKNSAQEASHKKKMIAVNEEKLITSNQLLRKYRQQIFKLQNQLVSQQEFLNQRNQIKNQEDDNPMDLRGRIVAKIPEKDRQYLNIEVDKGKVFIEIVDSVLFEKDNKLTKHGEELLANLKSILKEYSLEVTSNHESAAENGKKHHKTQAVNRILQTSNQKKLKQEQSTSTISRHKNSTSPLSLKNLKKMDKNPEGKTLIVVSEQEK